MATDFENIFDEDKKLFEWAEKVIFQRQYETIKDKSIRPLDAYAQSISPGDVTCLYNISELVFNKEEGCTEKLTIILNALYLVGASALMLLQHKNGKSYLYIGAINKSKSDNKYYINTIREVLRSSIEGNLPGTELKEIVSKRKIEEKLYECIDSGFDSQCITAVSCVPAVEKSEKKTTNKGIDSLLDAVGAHNFSLIIIADPVSSEKMIAVKQGYEKLSTDLSIYGDISYSNQWSCNLSESESISKGFSSTISKSISLTQSHSETNGWSHSASGTSTGLIGDTNKKGLAVIDRVTAAAMEVFNLQTGNITDATNYSSSVQNGKSATESETDGTSEQAGLSQTVGSTEGRTIQKTQKNRSIKEMIDRIDWYLKWFNSCENYGMFDSCAYVISSSASTNLIVASQFQALVQGEQEMNQPVTINTWTAENGVDTVKEYLLHSSHPLIQNDVGYGKFSPAMLMSSRELSRQMAFPQNSVVGLTVMQYASFGKEVVRKTPLRKGKLVRIGSVSHMGKTLKQPVVLDLQSMASHSFIAGTNGSGKSNAVFRIIEELMEASIPFMVIEPAKGEYKNVFGHLDNVKVYGSNRKKTELLRINPFWFNEDVEALEHIDKLMDIFNASWPMYSAMPAVLKASIEKAYEKCGWNLKKSICKGGIRVFPTVEDVLNQFNEKMESTAFSKEVQGNYIGALSTRLESLCNGIYGEIFGGKNLSDEELFDSNVIVDLSRIGSSETKSMIMGILVMRLQEYRMRTEAMNLPLKHITVLEEAHHLIRRTSTAQSEDGSNMMGKSVEMISNSIAEMRSYGEGFIIVDQSPGLMDMSVLRNTNTKVILRLPEAGDRKMVGDTMGLSDEQTYEISRLKTGSCAIYQKDWLEPVLCQVDRANVQEKLYISPQMTELWDIEKRLVEMLITPFTDNKEITLSEVNKLVESCSLSGINKRQLINELRSVVPNRKIRSYYVYELAKIDLDFPETDYQLWYDSVRNDASLIEIWGDSYEVVLQLTLEHLYTTNDVWRKVMSEVSGPFEELNNVLKEMRGRAFERLCPLDGKAVPMTDEFRSKLEKAYEVLKKSDETDKLLAELLRKSLDADIIRERGQLQPYTNIVWNIMGGDKTWNDLYPLLEKGELKQWDSCTRNILKNYVTSDENTITSLLGLFLQKKGAVRCVATQFVNWQNIARSIHS